MARKVLDARSAQVFESYALLSRNQPEYFRFEPEHNSICRYGDVMGESILLHLQPVMEAVVGTELLPCYSYLRVYGNDAQLRRHRDRPSCEISATLTLGGEAPDVWPIWLHAQEQDQSVMLPPGDMLVYRGYELPHWRDQFRGTYWVQLFLHYVTAGGEFKEFAFDGREGIGMPSSEERQKAFFDATSPRDISAKPPKLGRNEPCYCGSNKRYKHCHGKLV